MSSIRYGDFRNPECWRSAPAPIIGRVLINHLSTLTSLGHANYVDPTIHESVSELINAYQYFHAKWPGCAGEANLKNIIDDLTSPDRLAWAALAPETQSLLIVSIATE